jgi:hypothetical protein
MPQPRPVWIPMQIAHGAGETMSVELVEVCGSCGRRRDAFLIPHDPVACLRVHTVPH